MTEKKMQSGIVNGNTSLQKYKNSFLRGFNVDDYSSSQSPETFEEIEQIFIETNGRETPLLLDDTDSLLSRYGIPENYYWLKGPTEGSWALVKFPLEVGDRMWKVE